MDWKRYGVSALNALLSGAFAAAGSIAAGITLKQSAIVIGVAAFGSFAKWYAQHPLPGAEN